MLKGHIEGQFLKPPLEAFERMKRDAVILSIRWELPLHVTSKPHIDALVAITPAYKDIGTESQRCDIIRHSRVSNRWGVRNRCKTFETTGRGSEDFVANYLGKDVHASSSKGPVDLANSKDVLNTVCSALGPHVVVGDSGDLSQMADDHAEYFPRYILNGRHGGCVTEWLVDQLLSFMVS